MTYYFDDAFYIRCKLAQLRSVGQIYTEDSLKDAIAGAYGQPYTKDLARRHYKDYGQYEGLNANPYFNRYEYVQAKANQLNSTGETNPYGDRAWTAEDVNRAFSDANLTPEAHYERYGSHETDASGRYINPSNAFDANAYLSAKLLQCRQSGEAVNGHTGNDIALQDMLGAFQASDLSLITHYALYGADEVNESGIAFVQAVPMEQRMTNDSNRDYVTNEIVTVNCVLRTPPPRDSNARAVAKPSDAGGLADETISPSPVYQTQSPPVPGDDNYTPVPATIRDGPGMTVLYYTTTDTGYYPTDHWVVVENGSTTGIVVHRDTGAVLGQVDLETTTDENGRIFVAVAEEAATLPVSWLPAVDLDTLPSGVIPDMSLNNNINPDPPDPPGPDDVGGITAHFDEEGNLIIGGEVYYSRASVTLDADGCISDWSGQRDGASKPTQALGENALLSAWDVEARDSLDVLELTTSKTGWHTLYGGETFSTWFRVLHGAHVDGIIAGNADDTIILESGATVFSIDAGGGMDYIYINSGATVNGDINGGDGFVVITIASDATVNGTISGGGDDDYISVGGTMTGDINGDGGKDIINIAGTVTGDINGGDGNDSIGIQSVGTVNGDISGGDGNDDILIYGNATVNGAISGGLGADTLNLNGTARALEIGRGDTGAYTAPEGAAAFATANCDVIIGAALGTTLALGANWKSEAITKAEIWMDGKDNDAILFRGTHAASQFTMGAGTDLLLVYDANPTEGETAFQAVVLVGSLDLPLSYTADGGITFA